MRLFHISIFVSLVCVSACKKKEAQPEITTPELNTGLIRGLPERLDKVHGYFYAVESNSDANKLSRRAYALFAAQGGNLRTAYDHELEILHEELITGDLSMGVVRLDTHALWSFSLTGPRLYYSTSLQVDQQLQSARWSWSGTSQIQADTFLFENPFPRIHCRDSIFVINKDSNFYIVSDSMVARSDEASILLIGDHYRNGPYIAKRYSLNKGINYLYWSAEEVNDIFYKYEDSKPRLLSFKSYTHFHQYRHNKLYVFTFSTRIDCPISLQPN